MGPETASYMRRARL